MIQTTAGSAALGLVAGLLVSASAASAQEWGVARESFPFLDNRLIVAVEADVPGELAIIRGGVGAVEVGARAPGGIAGLGLTSFDRNRLTLTSVGGERVVYMVVVPEEVMVRVLLPGESYAQQVGWRQSGARFSWGGDAPREPRSPARTQGAAPARGTPETGAAPARGAAVGREAPAQAGPLPPRGPFVSYAAALAPGEVRVPLLDHTPRITVRTGGARFQVQTSRPLQVTTGSADVLEIRAERSLELVLVLPAGTRDFTLRLGEEEALLLRDGRGRALCEPLVEQTLPVGETWYTFTPRDGRVHCTLPGTAG